MNWMNAKKALRRYADPKRKAVSQSFFKTGPGQYGEGDIFLGVTAAQSQKVAEEFRGLSFSDLSKLLKSPVHEDRLLALTILTLQYRKADVSGREKIHRFYMKNLRYVNNWDLVDLSAPLIMGEHLTDRKRRKVLYTLARSKNFWARRVAIVSTYSFIRNEDFKDTLAITKLLLGDAHDLIHKASGWMLREAGKRDETVLIGFLEKHCTRMPRTMLRYAIERLTPKQRRDYLDR